MSHCPDNRAGARRRPLTTLIPATAYSLFGGCHYPAPLYTSPKSARDLDPPRVCGYRTPPPQKGAGRDVHTLLCLLGAEDLRLLGTRRRKAVPVTVHDGHGVVEHVLQVRLRDRRRGHEMLEHLRGLEGVDDVSLVLRDAHAEL